MTKDKPNSPDFSELRCDAQERFAAQQRESGQPPGYVEKLLHELQVHQIELELQNMELRNTQVQLQESLTQYADLYDFAPVGYFTLNEEGRILKANLAGASLLGVERSNLVNKPVRIFIAKESRVVFDDFRKTLFKTLAKQLCEVKLLRRGNLFAHALIEGMVMEDTQGSGKECRIAIIDITERKHAEMALRQAHDELEGGVLERTARLVAANQELQAEITERQQVQEILGKSDARFRSLVTATSQIVWTTNSMGEVVDDLPAWRAFTGQSEEELRGSGWTQALHPEDRRPTAQIWKQAVKSRTIYSAEYRLRRYDGEYRHVAARGVPVLDKDGSIGEWVGICTDITERKRTEETLRRYALLSKHAHEIILFISQDGRILEANDAACAAYGYDRGTILALTINDLQAPETRHQIPDQMEKAFSGGNFFESKHVRKDGSVFPVEVSARCVEFGEERILLSIIRDITERKQAEEKVSSAKAMLQTIFDGISDPLLMVEKDLTVRMLNEAAATYFRIADGKATTGKFCYELAFGKREPCDGCVVRSAILEGRSTICERKGLFDSERTEEVVVYPVDEADGGFSGAVIRISDITENRNLEKQIMRADRLSSLGQLSGGIAHEIRNPLAGISLFVDVLRNEEKFSRTSQEQIILEEIKHNVRKIDGIIRRVLSYARQSGSTSQSRLEVRQLIEDGLKLWRLRLANDGIQLRLSLRENLHEVLGDPIEIHQVLTNLIQNALEAMDEEGTLSISVENGNLSCDKKRPAVIIKVQDSGPGIPFEQQKNIFNPFFTTKYTGTGLGLAISHRIVARHGGFISFESVPDAGTTFTVELPAAPRD
ncbi:MAG: PAS domain S-box protein [Methanoregulaceae archaeon]|nr:PAS domain S-box protein [Methanoregulaceae archaeon]